LPYFPAKKKKKGKTKEKRVWFGFVSDQVQERSYIPSGKISGV